MTKHVPIKATRARVGNDPETRLTGPKGLATAVVKLGLEDAEKGIPAAWEFIDGRMFDFWCDRCGLHPDYLRRMLKQCAERPAPRPKSKTWLDLDEVMAQYRSGLSLRELAEMYAVSSSSIWSQLVRGGYLAGKG